MTESLSQEKASIEVGRELYGAGQFSQAAKAWEAASETYRLRGDRSNQALCLSYLSLAYQALNHWGKADRAILQSLSLLRPSEGKREKGIAEGVAPILIAQALNTQGALRLKQGQPENALTLLEEAQFFYQQADDQFGALGSQLNQARALQQLGFYRRSRIQLQDIATQLHPLAPSSLKVSSLRSLAIAYEFSGNLSESQTLLEQSLELAMQLNQTQDTETGRLLLGAVQLKLGQSSNALNQFMQVEQATSSLSTRQSAQLNRLDLYIQEKQWQQAMTLLTELAPALKLQLDSDPSRPIIDKSVRLSTHMLTLTQQGYSIDSSLSELLASAMSAAKLLNDTRAEAMLLEKLSQFYAAVGQVNDATNLAQKALKLSQNLQADDLIVLSAWQLGQLQVQQGQSDDAIATYQKAVDALGGLRSELASSNPNLQLSFRNSVEPIYRELITLLLPTLNQPSQFAKQKNLQQARHLMESLQLAEIDDFFREACIDSELVQIDQIDPTVTSLYSILLEDRLVTIASAPNQPLKYFAAPRGDVEVEMTLKNFMRHLNPAYNNKERLRLSNQLYDWLIRPAKESGVLEETDTLVFVSDGLLRNVPMAALHDGNQYLVEQYNIVLAPGLHVPESKSLSADKYKIMAAGISQSTQGLQALPGVKQEVNQIAQEFPSTVLLDQAFTANSLGNQIQNNQATVFHLATHGQFSSKATQTFLLTWDQKLNVRDLSSLLQQRQVSGIDPIELLILSACETAVGDDRATLGLAGISAKAGVRSILATLWNVQDDSTVVFMEEFYNQLKNEETTIAEALRQAQLALIKHPEYGEPYFWAPFTLVGNWR